MTTEQSFSSQFLILATSTLKYKSCMIEVEIRGHLIEPQGTQFKEYLEKNADSRSAYYDWVVYTPR